MADAEGPTTSTFFEVRAVDPSQRECRSSYIQSGEFQLRTRDDDDHTFYGIVFNVELTGRVPVEWLEVLGVSVRGTLGVVKVFTAEGGYEPRPMVPREGLVVRRVPSPLKPPHEWRLRYAGVLPPSPREPYELIFREPSRLTPGAGTDVLGIYVHAQHADGVVYNNQRHRGVTLEDAHVRILSGVAHTGETPCGTRLFTTDTST